MNGTVFDIKQFSVYDGPGIRTTVFLKGCPMRCLWCHNPEGLSPFPQVMVSLNKCIHCGRCEAICTHKECCIGCGVCVRNCPVEARRLVGTVYSSEALAELLLKDKEDLALMGGGITFSGGEPTLQSLFLIDVLDRLEGVHRMIETCGFCKPEIFEEIIHRLEAVYIDVKLVDSEKHKKYTGQPNEIILQNLRTLDKSGIPYVIRMPVIPGVNDTDENYEDLVALIKSLDNFCRIEFLPYHESAGAKYSMVGRKYELEGLSAKPFIDEERFSREGIQYSILRI